MKPRALTKRMKPSMDEVWGTISLSPLGNSTSTTKPPNPAALNCAGGGTNFDLFFNNADRYSDQHNSSKTNSFSNTKPMGFVPNPCSSSAVKKRPPKKDEDVNARQQRLIKNRESADRSRARKLAYIKELEKEMENLKEENAKLRQQLKEALPEKVGIMENTTKREAAAARELKPQKRNSLWRTLTAPF